MVLTFTSVALFVAIALTAGLARGFSGFGAALIFMPMASALASPQIAAAVLVLIDLVFSAPLIVRALGRVSITPIIIMLIGAAITVPLGTWVLKTTDPVLVRWMIAGLCGAMLVLLMSGWRYAGKPQAPITLGVGAMSGLFTGIAQLGGPPVVAYWLGGENKTAETRANIILFIAGSSLISLITYFFGGLFEPQSVAWAVITGPAYGLGLFAGARLFGLASEVTFRVVCFVLIGLAVVTSLPLWRS